MPLITLMGLVMQCFCMAVFWHRFKWKIFRLTGALFLLMALTYHGVLAEVLNVLFPGRNTYRELVSEEVVSYTVLLFSAGLALFSFSYLVGTNKLRGPFQFKSDALEKARDILNDNRNILVVATIGCYLVSFFFNLSSSFDQVSVSSEYWYYGLAIYLLPHLLLIATLALIVSYPGVPAEIFLALQMLINVTALRRSAVLFSIVITVIMIAMLQRRLNKRRVYLLFSCAVIVIVLISVSRGVFGRHALAEMNPFDRVLSVATSAAEGQGDTEEDVLDDFVYRFDANAPNALILDRLKSGEEPIGFTPILLDLLLQVPRALNQEKLESDVLERSSKAFIFYYYGADASIDYLQGWLGYFLACFGISGFLITMIVLGILFSRLDRWFVTTQSVLSPLVYYMLVFNIIYYEGVLMSSLTQARTIMMVVVVMFVVHLGKRILFAKSRLTS